MLIGISLIIASFLVFLLFELVPEPPVGEMEYARLTLARANAHSANTYSQKQFREAKTFYDSAMTHWRRQNQRFIYLRDYSRVAKYAKKSADAAHQASENSKFRTKNLIINTKDKIYSLKSLIEDINGLFNRYPLPDEVRDNIARGKLLLKESEIAFNKGQYIPANKMVLESENLLTSSYSKAFNDLKEYFRSFPEWKKMVEQSINESRINNSYSIIVDKFSGKCLVYLNGQKKYEFDSELGKNWVGDKLQKGDYATPEGMYKIKTKLPPSKTKYYKALLINYPNDEDIARFKRAKERGDIPASAKIGGLIEIHGNGGKGIDWTEGCIALKDSDMDIIYKIVDVGTRVTIIGSMVDLQQILKKDHTE